MSGLAAQAQTPTVVLNDSNVLQSTTKRVGVNLGTINYYDNGQMLKNLIGARNPGFEPTLAQRIWVLAVPGTTTSFTEPDIWDEEAPNYWTGATFKVINTQSGGAEQGCTGTIASNTGPNYQATSSTVFTDPVYTLSSPCAAPLAIGDVIVLTQTIASTPSAWWGDTSAGFWPDITGAGQLTSDTTDLCATCGAQAIELNATAAGSVAGVASYFDSAYPFDIFVMMNGTYHISFWAKIAAGSPSLVVTAGRFSTGGFLCTPPSQPLTTSWASYTMSCTASETAKTTSPGTAYVKFDANGGAVYLDNVSFQKVNTDPTNTTVFRDEVFNALKNYYNLQTGGNPGMLRDWLEQDGETFANWTAPDYARRPSGGAAAGSIQLSLEDYLNLCKALNAEPYFEVPVTITDADAKSLIEFLAGSTSTPEGARRAALGQTAPWTTIFDQIHLSYCNECWNGLTAGSSLPYRPTAPANDYYYDYSVRAGQVFADMRSAPDYTQGAFDLVLNAQTATNFSVNTAIARSHPDSIELEDYTYNSVSSFANDTQLWQPDFVEAYNKATNPSDPTNFYQSLHEYQNLNTCGASGANLCNVNVYEWGSGTLSGSIDQTHLDAITAGAGTGVLASLQSLLNLQTYGITADSYFALAEYQNGSLNGNIIKAWGISVDMGGATNNMRPQYLGLSLVNQSIIGPMYSCPISNSPTYNFLGSALNGTNVPPGTPANAAVPYLYTFCFQNGSNRSMVLINTDLSSSHTVNFAGSNIPSGTVGERQYAPSSPDLLNEAATGTATNTTAASVFLTSTTLSSPTSVTLPPMSVTALDFTSGTSASGGQASAPVFTVAAGTYTSVQSVGITDATASATIYYTTDGSTPTTSSAVYTGPISVAATTTINAIATAPSYTTSAVGSSTYTINLPMPIMTPPSFSLAAGSYQSTQTVTITDTTPGAVIHYTVDGTTPTASSPVYSGWITVNVSETIQAIAVETGYVNSSVVADAIKILDPVTATPVFSIGGGVYNNQLSVTVTDATPGAVIYYTTNQSTPTSSSTVYNGPITVNSAEYIQAIAIAPGYVSSPTTGSNYNMTAAVPAFSVAAGSYSSAQTVAITTASTGASIFYTTDGTTPATTSKLYTGPITVKTSETVQAIANEYNYTISKVASAAYTIGTQTATPTFSIPAGSYISTQTVAIADATSNATIYYTTNGTTPTSSSAVYSGPLTVSATETLEAIAVSATTSQSAVATDAITINLTAAATPTFSVAPGVYSTAQTVSISDATAGATIYYTTNGTTPTTSSAVYTAPIAIDSTETVEAIAVLAASSSAVKTTSSATAGIVSAVATATYTIASPAATPAFSVPAGSYSSAQSVTITDSTPGAVIYYTLNGATPTTSSTLYTGPVTISTSENLEAIATAPNYAKSALFSAVYSIGVATTAPVFSIPAGTYNNQQTVSLSTPTPNAVIYYTTNQSTPTTSSAVYTTPLLVNSAEYVQAIAVAPGLAVSAVSGADYNMTAAVPTFSVAAGSYSSAQTVAITTASTGASIFYTTDGTTPATTSKLYTGPITVKASETIQAIANEYNYTISKVASAAYTIGTQTATPAFSLAAGSYSGTQTVSITDATSGAVIYYTTNGTTPTTSSAVYSGAITVSATETLEALAIASGDTASSVATAAYSIATGGKTATPVYSIPSGAYNNAQTVAITDSTPGAVIYYTTNQTTPTTASTIYTGPISVTVAEYVQAIAVAPGYSNSAVAASNYSLTTAVPVISLASGTYTTAQTVTIADATTGAGLYYTTDGTTPTTMSKVYKGPITVNASETLQVLAFAYGYNSGKIASATYVIGTQTAAAALAPVFSIATGTYDTAQTVKITDLTAGAVIHYTTNGATPSSTSAIYTSPVKINSTATLKAIAVAPKYLSSAVTVSLYTIDNKLFTPKFSLAPGTYSKTLSVTITEETAGAVIHYTTNGTTPTASSAEYKNPITVSETEHVQAIAVKSGAAPSTIASAVYTLIAARPAVSLKTGTYAESQTVTLESSTPRAKIYYTLDGATPTVKSTPYKEAISIDSSETIKAIAIASGFKESPVVSEDYDLVAGSPEVSVKAGTYSADQSVILKSTTPAAKIYYTVNGSTPTAKSTLYKAAIEIKSSETIKAIAVASGFKTSNVASEEYALVAGTPEISLKGGTYEGTQKVTIKSATPGAKIYYTLNGATPTTASKLYTGPITIKDSETLKVIAVEPDFKTSTVISEKYVVVPKIA